MDDFKISEAYALGFRNGRSSVMGIEANGEKYVGIDDSIIRVNVRLTESTFKIEVYQKRHGDHWTRLQDVTSYEINKMEAAAMKREFEARKMLKEAGIEPYASDYSDKNSFITQTKLKTHE